MRDHPPKTPAIIGNPIRTPGGACTLYLDVVRRVATCRICGGPIPKGEVRATIDTPTPATYGQQYKGRVRHWFFHRACLASYLTHPGDQSHSCYDCRKPFSEHYPADAHPCYTGSYVPYARICDECVKERRWVLCQVCSIFVPKYSVSPAIIDEVTKQALTFLIGDSLVEPLDEPVLICERCSENHDIPTIRSQKQAVKTRAREERRFENVREKLLKAWQPTET